MLVYLGCRKCACYTMAAHSIHNVVYSVLPYSLHTVYWQYFSRILMIFQGLVAVKTFIRLHSSSCFHSLWIKCSFYLSFYSFPPIQCLGAPWKQKWYKSHLTLQEKLFQHLSRFEFEVTPSIDFISNGHFTNSRYTTSDMHIIAPSPLLWQEGMMCNCNFRISNCKTNSSTDFFKT